MADFVEHIPCTYADCGSSDGMALYKDGTGYCFVCNRYDKNPTKLDAPPPAPRKESNDYLSSIADLPFRGFPDRGIRAETAERFGVRSELSTTDGRSIVAHYYPYQVNGVVTGYKRRSLPKDFSWVGTGKSPELFGQANCQSGNRRLLVICEGELDCLSLYQVMKDHNKGTKWDYIEPCVVSIPNGASAAVKDVSRNLAFVSSFDKVVLALDQDAPGKEATVNLLKLLPMACVAEFDEKDANDMLLKGKSEALYKSVVFNAKVIKPASVVSIADIKDRALARPQMGLSWPWPTLTKSTYGIQRKTIYGLGAGVSMGKTEFAKELEAHLLNHHKLPIGMIMLEEDAGMTLKTLAGKVDGVQYHKPDTDYDEAVLSKTIDSFEDRVKLYDHFGVKDWEDVKAAIRYMVVSEGIKDIFLDPLTALVSHVSASEANDLLNTIMGELAGLTHELDFTCYYFCHLNTPTNGPPHERGGKVVEQQFTGSRSMMRWSQYIFGLEGNKDPEIDEVERNTRYLTVLKDRYYGNTTRFPIFFNRHTGAFKEPAITGY